MTEPQSNHTPSDNAVGVTPGVYEIKIHKEGGFGPMSIALSSQEEAVGTYEMITQAFATTGGFWANVLLADDFTQSHWIDPSATIELTSEGNLPPGPALTFDGRGLLEQYLNERATDPALVDRDGDGDSGATGE